MIHCRILCAFALLIAFSLNASARELWVDKQSRGGACSNARIASAVTKTAPLCTLGAAAQVVQPGDLVHVRGATYNEPQTCSVCDDIAVLQLIRPGTALQWIRFVAEPGETVILEGSASASTGVRIRPINNVPPSFNEVRGFVIRKFTRNCVSYQNVPDIRIASVDVGQCGSGAVELHGAQRVTLQNSNIHDNVTSGWTSAVDLYLCREGNLISSNRIWNNADNSPDNPDTEGHGITMDYCQGAGGTVIENNLIYNNEGWCMSILNSNSATIRNNVCYRNGIRSGAGEISALGNYTSVYNNILAPRSGQTALNLRFTRSDFVADPSTMSENNNLFDVPATAAAISWGDSRGTLAQYKTGNGRGWGSASITADPRFVDEFGFNFHLQSSSPAIDKGNTSKASLADFDGAPRPAGAAAEIGAFEVGTASTLAGSSVASIAAVNLTLIGTRDWAKWPNYVHKSSGGAQISNVTGVGNGIVAEYDKDPRIIAWSDGIPTISGADAKGVYATDIGKGLQLSAPAGTKMRTLVVYVGGWYSGGRLVAHLSDNSAADYVNSYSAAGHYGLVYTLTYRAASDGQQLLVTWTQTSGTGTIQLQAAALH